MQEALLAALEEALALLPEPPWVDRRLLAAVSGGPDSVALLRALCALRDRERGRAPEVYAAHVEHGLRGESSLEDERFTRALCETLHVRLFVEHARLPGGMDAPGAEARAREARYRFFKSVMDRTGATVLLTAHHRDDQAETVLMNLLRGSGARGLSGMRALTRFGDGYLLRPFLRLSKATLHKAALENGGAFRRDESNDEPTSLRNRLRLQTLPSLERMAPGCAERIAGSAERLQADDECLTALAEQALWEARRGMSALACVRKAPLQGAHIAIATRALRMFAQETLEQTAARGEYGLNERDTLALVALLRDGATGEACNLPAGLKCVSADRRLHIVRQDGDAPLRAPAYLSRPLPAEGERVTLGCATVERVAVADALGADAAAARDGVHSVALPAALAEQPLELRLARTGDWLTPFGMAGRKKLARYWMDAKLDAPLRPFAPVLAVGGEVLWAVGVGASERTRLRPDEQPWARLRVAGALPWDE